MLRMNAMYVCADVGYDMYVCFARMQVTYVCFVNVYVCQCTLDYVTHVCYVLYVMLWVYALYVRALHMYVM